MFKAGDYIRGKNSRRLFRVVDIEAPTHWGGDGYYKCLPAVGPDSDTSSTVSFTNAIPVSNAEAMSDILTGCDKKL